MLSLLECGIIRNIQCYEGGIGFVEENLKRTDL